MKLPKKRTVLTLLLILVLGGLALVAAPQPKAMIVVQPNSPIEIISYTARFHERSGALTPEGIEHTLQYKNRGAQKVVAISFGVLSFDVFNRFLGTTEGFSMRDLAPGKTERSTWIHNPYAAFSFLTGLAYVNLVRLEDGTLWQADEAAVLAEIRKIEKDFDAKLLKEKEGPGR